jgi:NAD(P)-dependent dehydrogenase (short-subunit alcohol dehydrogenase family)
MTRPIRGLHVVVTGGGGGLGAAIAAAFAADGATLTLMGRTPATLEAQTGVLRKTFGVEAGAEACDVSDPDSVERAFAAAVRARGPVHVLVNNAGYAAAGLFQETTLDEWRQVLDVNLTGTFLCTQRVLPGMLEAGEGCVINIASTAGLRGYTRVAAYCAAKHGVVGLTRALAAETKRTGVTVNAVCPGYIEGTPMLHAAIANVARNTGTTEEAARAILAKGSPNGSFVEMGEVAVRVVWLCSVEASATTGYVVTFDDGGDMP